MAVSRAGGLALVGGVLALDFANTAGGRDTAEPIEHLRSADDLAAWAVHVGAIDAEAALRWRAAIARDPAAAAAVLRRALRLREAVYAIGSAITRGAAAPAAELDILKDIVREVMGLADLMPAKDGYRLDFTASPADVAVLGPVAWSALELLTRGDLERLKQCPAQDCGWLFLDHSKNGSRRWCDMATCGNRAKARSHRGRR